MQVQVPDVSHDTVIPSFSGDPDSPLRGLSASVFEPRSGKWKQTWVDNQGSYLNLTGEFKDGQMILAREVQKKDGSKVIQRMVYKNITPNSFDWSWESSQDSGKNVAGAVAHPLHAEGIAFSQWLGPRLRAFGALRRSGPLRARQFVISRSSPM